MITMLHNPRCSTSRKVLEMLAGRGIEPTIIDYMRQPLSRQDLVAILVALGKRPAGILRRKEAEWIALGLDADSLGDQEMLDILLAHPKLIERPIVVSGRGAAIGRPPEAVLAIL